jgi:hypothetical protein
MINLPAPLYAVTPRSSKVLAADNTLSRLEKFMEEKSNVRLGMALVFRAALKNSRCAISWSLMSASKALSAAVILL